VLVRVEHVARHHDEAERSVAQLLILVEGHLDLAGT
jgi:hypothetical protein